MIRLIDYLPEYYQSSEITESVITILEQEIDELFEALTQTLDQIFIGSATWGLSNWEGIMGLPVDGSLPAEERRRRVLVKRRGASKPLLSILQAIAPTLEARFGGDIIPLVVPAGHNFSEYDFGPLVPPLEIYKPAHKGYSFQLLPPDQPCGYVIYSSQSAGREKVAFQPEAGAVYAGRWPRWNTRGVLYPRRVVPASTVWAGTGLFCPAGWFCGIASEKSTRGAVVSNMVTPRAQRVVGDWIYPVAPISCGVTPASSSPGNAMIGEAAISAMVSAGRGGAFPCGTIYSGEVAA